jgi:hypothetical protein
LQPWAETEGFAHFFAANLMNLATNNSCTFIYYKDYLLPDGTPHKPPNAVPCFYNSGPPQMWMQNKCATGNTSMGADGVTAGGVEWDWLTFFWELHNRGANAYTSTDLQHVYQQACNGNVTSLCASAKVFFDTLNGGSSTLKQAAASLFGSAKSQYFIDAGKKHGINVLP